MSLFNTGYFVLNSGGTSRLKIDCDYLSDESIEKIAEVIRWFYRYTLVVGIPTGGDRLANILKKYQCEHIGIKEKRVILVVDDVLTTGGIMFDWMHKLARPGYEVLGFVIFARGKLPKDVKAFWQLGLEID